MCRRTQVNSTRYVVWATTCVVYMMTRYRRISSVAMKIDAWFARQLQNLVYHVKNIISTNVPMEMLSKEWEAYRNAIHCYICEKPFAPDDTRIHDHCHLTGRYRGPFIRTVI